MEDRGNRVIKAWHKSQAKPDQLARVLDMSLTDIYNVLVGSGLISEREYKDRIKFEQFPDGHCRRCGIKIFKAGDMPKVRRVLRQGTRVLKTRRVYTEENNLEFNDSGLCVACYHENMRETEGLEWETLMESAGWRTGLVAGTWVNGDVVFDESGDSGTIYRETKTVPVCTKGV